MIRARGLTLQGVLAVSVRLTSGAECVAGGRCGWWASAHTVDGDPGESGLTCNRSIHPIHPLHPVHPSQHPSRPSRTATTTPTTPSSTTPSGLASHPAHRFLPRPGFLDLASEESRSNDLDVVCGLRLRSRLRLRLRLPRSTGLPRRGWYTSLNNVSGFSLDTTT
jgi:hypothetical protein